jgi:hypothetical protein
MQYISPLESNKNMEILDVLIGLEKKLHSFNAQKSKKELDILLSEKFKEIGASGRIYTKKEVLDNLTKSRQYEIEATDFNVNELSPGIMQLLYKTTEKADSSVIRTTVRHSLWKKHGNNWKMIFHQGTVSSEN